MISMFLIGAGVLIADMIAAVGMVGSMWLERRLGWSRGLLVDWAMIATVIYGLVAWKGGSLIAKFISVTPPAEKPSEHRE